MYSGARRLYSRTLLGAAVIGTVAVLPVAATQEMSTDPVAFLRRALQLSTKEAAVLAQGRAIVKTLPATTKREVITGGAVRIRGVASTFVEQFRTLEGFRTSQFVLQIARFSDPPQLSDLDPLTIDQDDLDALRACRIEDCGVRLAAEDIQRFAADLDWRASDAPQKAAGLYKSMLLAYLNAYREGGLDQLVQYADQEAPTRLSDETRQLLTQQPSPLDAAPALRNHLLRFPADAVPRTEHFFYWSKEAFGFKPVVGLNHVSMHTTDSGQTIIVTTQIYASHYMDGQSAVSALFPASDKQPAFHWFYVNRARIGRLDGLLGSLSKPIVQRRARNGLNRSLTQTKVRMEAAQQPSS